MPQIVIGTAGHIDHGKTALVKALTGTDTDHLAEEKARGMTIDLGFAYLNDEITIIDVPGHEKFIRNMVAGVSTIHIAILVVAADDGVMPQTKEHLQILNLLDVPRGIITITKTDLAEIDDWVDLVELDIRELVKNTFLRDAPIIRTSVNPIQGIDELKTAIFKEAASVKAGEDRGFFRLPVDRVFTKKGFGLVVTGTVLSGAAKAGDELVIIPGNTKAKVRGLQSHGLHADHVKMGDRAALNLAGLEKNTLWRGSQIVAPKWIKSTHRIIGNVSLVPDTRWKLKSRQRVHVHLGTAEVVARITIPGSKTVKAGGQSNVILDFEQPVSIAMDDRFIIRSFSPMETMGGGIVLDPHPVPVKRELRRWTETLAVDPVKRLGQYIDLFGHSPKSLTGWTHFFHRSKDWVLKAADSLQLEGDEGLLFSAQVLSLSLKNISDILKSFHEKTPYQKSLSLDRIRHMSGLSTDWITLIMKKAEAKGIIAHSGMGYALAGHEISLSAEDEDLANTLGGILEKNNYNLANTDSLASEIRKEGKKALELLHILKDAGKVMEVVQGHWIHRKTMEKLSLNLKKYFNTYSTLKVTDFKEITGTTRKNAIPLLEYCDKNGLTVRDGDIRLIGEMLE